MKRRVVITGMGVVSPLGIGKEQFWKNLIQGESAGTRMDELKDNQGIYPLKFSEKARTKIGAPVLDFDPLNFMREKKARRTGRTVQFALAAAKLALKDAGLELRRKKKGFKVEGINPARAGVLIGTCLGDLNILERNHRNFLEQGPRGIEVFFTPNFMNNAPSAQISIQYGITGPSSIVGTACGSGTHAIGNASDKIKMNRAELMLTGGVEAILTSFMFGAFSTLRATTARNNEPEKASRPFDKKRDGFLPGEGAGILVLESLDHAQKRGAEIQAELKGFGESNDSYHITTPDPEGTGAKKAMEQALTRGKVSKEEVDYINAHGTSTPLNDKMETLAMKKVFGKKAYQIPVSSTKSQIGHPVAGAGAIEAIATVLAIEKKLIPATINYETADPECDLDYVPNEPREKETETALSNSFGFGGHNGTLCLSRMVA